MTIYTEKQAREMTRQRRYDLRQQGCNVPKFSPGQKKGYKQTPEHAKARIRRGVNHYRWTGDSATQNAGRCRARRLYPALSPCIKCNSVDSERHHIDGNTLNNEPNNIMWLCTWCHMELDGRLEAVRQQAKRNQPMAAAASAAVRRSRKEAISNWG